MAILSQKLVDSLLSANETTLENSSSSLSQTVDGAQWLGQYIPLHYHFQMLQDSQRLSAFRQAIELHVKPDMHVVELGGGTGILSSFAARCGARVTCVERNPQLAAFAQTAIQRNGLSSKIKIIVEDANDFIPESKVDVVICEMLHVGLLREKQTEVITSFQRNYLSKFGPSLPRFLPEASRQMVQLIEHPFDFAGYYAPMSIFQSPDQTANDGLHELSQLTDYEHIFYDQSIPELIQWQGEIEVQCDGFLSALRFVTQNYISIEADDRSPLWPNQFLILPLAEPSAVIRGQKATVTFAYHHGSPLESLQNSIQVRLDSIRVSLQSF
jgi:type I protein arginine methyltransferase